MKFQTLALMILTSQSAHAVVSINSPAAGSKIEKSTVISGACSSSNDVRLAGPGIDAGKRISCDKKKWSYSLKNAFKDMKDGTVTITVSQDSSSVARSFVKGSAVVVVPQPEVPTPAVTCNLNGKILKENETVRAFQDAVVAYGQTCQEQTRKCTASGLSGSYQNLSCVVSAQPQNPNVGDLDPSAAPATNFDLSLWKITLPVNSSGQIGGAAVEVKNIGATFQKAPYFYTAQDGAMVFMAPTDGARTSGSKYPRSELREMDASGKEISWTVEQGGELHATLSVNELPVTSAGAKGRIVIGQIHGPDDELCRLYYDDGKLYFYDDKATSSIKETQFILKSASGQTTNIALNEKFEYSIIADRNNLTVIAVHNGVEYRAVDPVSSFWPGKALYFKAGAYVQVSAPGSGAGNVGSGKGQVSFYRLLPPSH